MSLIVLIIIGISAVVLLVFTIIQSQKEKREFEEEMNNKYPKSIDEDGEFDDDGL